MYNNQILIVLFQLQISLPPRESYDRVQHSMTGKPESKEVLSVFRFNLAKEEFSEAGARNLSDRLGTSTQSKLIQLGAERRF